MYKVVPRPHARAPHANYNHVPRQISSIIVRLALAVYLISIVCSSNLHIIFNITHTFTLLLLHLIYKVGSKVANIAQTFVFRT